MTDRDHSQATPPADLAGKILGELADVVSEQQVMAKSEDFGGLETLNGRVAELLGRLETIGRDALQGHVETITRIGRLRHELRLILAQRKHQLSEDLARLSHGRSAFSAYRDASS